MADGGNNGSLSGLLNEVKAIEAEIAQQRAELDAIHTDASNADRLAVMAESENASVHEVMGIGRYAIPSHSGWEALLEVVNDPSVDINFSSSEYPFFDKLIYERTRSESLDNPLDAGYEKPMFVGLRENLAAVRNFLMQTYYANTPPGMTHDKAKTALEQIAGFVGDGLSNNLRFFGLIPNHDPSKPFIDVTRAAEPNGKGAQYIYDRILAMNRQSDWRTFFSGIFGNAYDWQLPSGDQTPFGAAVPHGMSDNLAEDLSAEERLLTLEAQRVAATQKLELTAHAIDIDAAGTYLLGTANELQGVHQLAQPVARESIDLAHRILRGLKLDIGVSNVLDGLRMHPQDVRTVFTRVQGVASIYEQLVAWGRGIDATITQHPAVMVASQAVGQLAFLAKMEALRLAQGMGNTELADRLAMHLHQMPGAFKQTGNTTFGELLERVGRGIDTVLNRVQNISGPGAAVGHTPYKELGSYMGAAPLAGMEMHVGADGANNRDAVGKRNAEILAAEEAAMQAQAARIQSQNARRAATNQQAQPTTPARPARGQQAVQQARTQQQQQQRRGTNPATVTPQQQQQQVAAAQRALMARQNAIRVAHAHDHDHDHHHDAHHRPAGAAPGKINPNLLSGDMLAGFKAATSMKGVTGAPVTTGRVSPDLIKPLKTDAEKKQQLETPPVPPHKGGHAR